MSLSEFLGVTIVSALRAKRERKKRIDAMESFGRQWDAKYNLAPPNVVAEFYRLLGTSSDNPKKTHDELREYLIDFYGPDVELPPFQEHHFSSQVYVSAKIVDGHYIDGYYKKYEYKGKRYDPWDYLAALYFGSLGYNHMTAIELINMGYFSQCGQAADNYAKRPTERFVDWLFD